MPKLLIFLISLWFISCTRESTVEIPEHLQDIVNLTVFPQETVPSSTISFVRESSFGDTDDILFQSVGHFTVDEIGRVLIVDWPQRKINIFNPDGSYLATIGQQGSGPGDFQSISAIRVVSDRLYIHDTILFRGTVYSLDDYSLVSTVDYIPTNLDSFREMDGSFVNYTFIRSDGSFLVRYYNDVYPEDLNTFVEDSMRYVLMDEGGDINTILFAQRGRRFMSAYIGGELRRTYFSFLGESLFALSNDDYLVSGLTSDFLIEVNDSNGNYLHSIYYKVKRRPFKRDEAIESVTSDFHKSIISLAAENQFPEYWPILDNLLVDDENRIWVSTIGSDETIHEWWVLERSGELIAKFDWPTDVPIVMIKGGHIYTREMEEGGFTRIVRHRIVLT